MRVLFSLLFVLIISGVCSAAPIETTTISGAIATIEEQAPIEGASPILKMRVITKEGAVEVYLGPVTYLSHGQLPFRPDDRVEVTGSWAEIEGERVLIASTIRKGHYLMKLRTHHQLHHHGAP